MPTYHLANVVDDYLMGISHVIRGEEWLPSAPLHVMLYRYLGWEEVMPQFAHLPLLLKPEGNGKLSKRDGDRLGFPVFPLQWTDPKTEEVSSGYRESGYYPEAVANMLALLGWHPSGNQEMFSMEELIAEFSLERVSKSGAKFDVQKALWFNQQYLQRKPLNEQYELLKHQIAAKGHDVGQEYVEQVIALMREKVQFAKEVVEEGYYFFEVPKSYDEEVIRKKWKTETGNHMLGLADAFGHLAENAVAEDFETAFKSYCETAGVKTGELLQPLRVAVSGAPMGPPIWEMIALIGRDFILPRLRTAAEKITVAGA
jgi:glutamyl-tRNA synthetase